ncbi:MAG: TolC family protein [Epsilonproteobacteria bacterium]|nr:TolC family protein [Campylobacterota bacterium]
MKYIFLFFYLFSSLSIYANNTKTYEKLALKDALEIVQEENLEIDIAEFDRQVAKLGLKVAKGYSYGKLDAELMGLRSNDAGNVFGFKLQSREADFAAFGFDQFLSALGGAMMTPDGNMGDFANFAQNFGNPNAQKALLETVPDKLNNPDVRNHYDLKLVYMLPLYTGGKLSNYRDIAEKMIKMGRLDKQKVEAQKKYEVRKTYYDISLLYQFELDLTTIQKNIEKLRMATIDMRDEGYAKKTDLMEVESKLSNVERMLFQAQAHKELSYQFLSFLLNAEVKSIKRISLNTFDCEIPLKNILMRNRDIQKAELGHEIQSKMIDVAKASYKPEIGAFAEYGSSDDKFLNEFTAHDRYTVGVQAKFNILNGGVDSAKIEQEKLKRLKVKKQIELAKKGISLHYKKINTEIQNLDNQIESIKKEIALTDEIYKAYQERYREGLASINDVVIKQSLQIEKLLSLLELQNSRNEKILQIYKMAY